jgi:hypothetical protein
MQLSPFSLNATKMPSDTSGAKGEDILRKIEAAAGDGPQ